MIQIRMQQGLSQDARIIRQEVFVEEQGFHHEFDEIDQAAWHLVLYENGHAAGCCRLFTSDNPDVYILGRLAVRKSCRGRQYGERLVREAEGWLRGLHVKRLALSARSGCARFMKNWDIPHQVMNIWMNIVLTSIWKRS